MELKYDTNPVSLLPLWVLIVPFMELKFMKLLGITLLGNGLNRTFYGIEIPHSCRKQERGRVLIVPFMELKSKKKAVGKFVPAS